MNILKAIGAFFARIGRWIRDTAWVQPLLIVGGIFAIIFSIPSIVSGVSSWFNSGNGADNYYSKNEVRLYLSGADKGNSDADQLIKYLKDYEDGKATDAQKAKYGEKFFLAFVQTGCSGCETNYPGFEALQTGWSSYNMKGSFRLFTIYIDEEATYTLPDKSKQLFDYFYTNNGAEIIFDNAAEIGENRPYYNNAGTDYSTNLTDLTDPEKFPTPTTFLIDMEYTDESYGISEVFFTLTGYNNGTASSDYAYRLKQCWEHTGMFADNWDKK